MEKIKVDVHFRKFKGDFDGQVTAVFPYDIQTKYNVGCYAHMGQHSECSPDYVLRTKAATEAEYLPLKKELEGIGYELNIIKRRNHKTYLKAYWKNRSNS